MKKCVVSFNIFIEQPYHHELASWPTAISSTTQINLLNGYRTSHSGLCHAELELYDFDPKFHVIFNFTFSLIPSCCQIIQSPAFLGLFAGLTCWPKRAEFLFFWFVTPQPVCRESGPKYEIKVYTVNMWISAFLFGSRQRIRTRLNRSIWPLKIDCVDQRPTDEGACGSSKINANRPNYKKNKNCMPHIEWAGSYPHLGPT